MSFPPCLLLSTYRSRLEAPWNNRPVVSDFDCTTEPLGELSKPVCVQVSCPLNPWNRKLHRWDKGDSDAPPRTKSYTLNLVFATGLSHCFQPRKFARPLSLKPCLNSLLAHWGLEAVCFSFHCLMGQNFLFPFIFFAWKLANSFISTSLSCDTLSITVNSHSNLDFFSIQKANEWIDD